MIQIHTTKNKRLVRASLKESTQQALTTHQDVKIPDGPIVIDKESLEEILSVLHDEAAYGRCEYCEYIRNKLNNLYPFLNQ